MDLNEYKWSLDLLEEYIRHRNKIHVLIDFTAVLRSYAAELLHRLRNLPEKKCVFYVPQSFDRLISHLIEDTESGFCSEQILNSIVPAWEEFSKMNLHTIDDKKSLLYSKKMFTGIYSLLDDLKNKNVEEIENSLSSFEVFKELSYAENSICIITGNETEAWRHILGKNKGSVLLVTDSCFYFFEYDSFDNLIKKYGSFEEVTNRKIPDNCGLEKCETATVKKSFLFFNKRHTIHYTDPPLSQDGAEGIIYKTDTPEIAVKTFYNSVSDQKIKKLKELIALEDKRDNFAWPLEFIYSTDHSYTDPIGFTMPLFSETKQLEGIHTYDMMTNHIKWKIATNFLASTLYLYMHGIQLGDYNFNNFAVSDDCKVIFMDVDSYVYGIYGTEMHGRQLLPFTPDYTNRLSVINADYYLLNCIVFWILADGLWPYYYDEDKKRVICRIHITEAPDFHDSLKQFPDPLRRYFKKFFNKELLKDPFVLFFILLDVESFFD